MAAARPLNNDVTAEILLRLPPDEPEHLFRAALACKPWLRIICDPAFRRRYREFHGAPPLLGLLHRLTMHQENSPARFASTISMPEFLHPGSDGRRTRSLDCRHGRVLIHMLERESWCYLVWDPITGDRQLLPAPDMKWPIYSAAVLCAADGCDHLDCHGGPFRIVFVATHDCKYIIASVFSSETGEWDELEFLDNTCEIYAQHMREGNAARTYYAPYFQPKRGTLVGDAVYFTLWRNNAIVKYDLVEGRLSMIEAPPPTDGNYVTLMAMRDNSLGFACIEGSSLCTWSRKVDTEEAVEWVQYRLIELEKTVLPVANPNGELFVVGFAEGVGVIFVWSPVGLFTIKLNSGQVKKVHGPGEYFSVLPYMSFYTPDRGRLLSLARIKHCIAD